jgi:hypothetical protein
MDESHRPSIDLAAACAALKIPWHVGYRWVLVGRLKGERRAGRWFVTEQSLADLRSQPEGRERLTGEAPTVE